MREIICFLTEIFMKKDNPKSFVWVRDEKEREFLCPRDAVTDPEHPANFELGECIDVEAVEKLVGKVEGSEE
jgi:hypothetical protein